MGNLLRGTGALKLHSNQKGSKIESGLLRQQTHISSKKFQK